MTEQLAERRRRLLRDEISRIAVNMFAERGFDNVTVGEIAAAAGLSERTLFRYFATKDELLLGYEHHLWERLGEALAARPHDEGPVTALREAFLATSHVEPQVRERVLQLGRILAQAPELQARTHARRLNNDDVIVEMVAGRLPGRRAKGRDLARVIVSAMSAVAATEFNAWVAAGGRGDPAVRIGEALHLLETGLRQLDANS
ncbi:TetR family transcriptional regulator [Mycolicibacterium flavescens]|uniref:TetR family transcriptional regulator n=1 Tax=Mycolicibacterium flavescens TaxID=1776 RepID=A0A1E3RDK5_MYCFV|nr:TetR family transcriptional regulator [Mycolicibacterium flavescens]MCV7282386.1 TetR family transcriptional regulator [Mycolicibacterium flavescens]ODQ87911.1 TetR family transcriptional regulator [Mycolicibacterium flavescens]